MKITAYVLLTVCLALAVCVLPVEAAPSIKFVATDVYWSGPYRLVVEGYFLNNGSKLITGITYFELTAYAVHGGQRLYLGNAAWRGHDKLEDVRLYPGETSTWTFTVNTERYIDFSYWEVDSYYEYNFLR